MISVHIAVFHTNVGSLGNLPQALRTKSLQSEAQILSRVLRVLFPGLAAVKGSNCHFINFQIAADKREYDDQMAFA